MSDDAAAAVRRYAAWLRDGTCAKQDAHAVAEDLDALADHLAAGRAAAYDPAADLRARVEPRLRPPGTPLP